MKLNNILYALIAASVTLGNVVRDEQDSQNSLNQDNQKQEQNNDTKNFGDCNAKAQQLNECIKSIESISNFKSKCETYRSEKCKIFAEFATAKEDQFADIFSSFNCNSSSTTVQKRDNSTSILATNDSKTTVSLAKIWSKAYDVACVSGDNKDKVCPIGYAYIDVENYNTAINESCKSKTCTDAAYAFLEEYLGEALRNNLGVYVDDANIKLDSNGIVISDSGFAGISEYKDNRFNGPFSKSEASRKDQYNYYAMAFLKSDYCTRQQGSSSGSSSQSSTSDATTLKYSMMFTIIALLFALF